MLVTEAMRRRIVKLYVAWLELPNWTRRDHPALDSLNRRDLRLGFVNGLWVLGRKGLIVRRSPETVARKWKIMLRHRRFMVPAAWLRSKHRKTLLRGACWEASESPAYPGSNLSVPAMAARLGVSERQLQRTKRWLRERGYYEFEEKFVDVPDQSISGVVKAMRKYGRIVTADDGRQQRQIPCRITRAAPGNPTRHPGGRPEKHGPDAAPAIAWPERPQPGTQEHRAWLAAMIPVWEERRATERAALGAAIMHLDAHPEDDRWRYHSRRSRLRHLRRVARTVRQQVERADPSFLRRARDAVRRYEANVSRLPRRGPRPSPTASTQTRYAGGVPVVG